MLYLRHGADEQVRRQVVAKLAVLYPDLVVRLRSAEIREGRGIVLGGLSIYEPKANGPQAELVRIDEILLCCATDIDKLLLDGPKITRVSIRRPVLRATRRPDGSFSVSKLLWKIDPRARIPQTFVEGGTIEVFDPLKNPSSTLTLRDLNLTFGLGKDSQPGRPRFEFEGHVTGDYLTGSQFRGAIDPLTWQWSIEGAAEGLDLCPELVASLPSLPDEAAERIEPLAGLRAKCGLEYRLDSDPRREQTGGRLWHYELKGAIPRGTLDHPSLPQPLTELTTHFVATHELIKLDRFSAALGSTTIQLDAVRHGSVESSPLAIRGSARGLVLDRRLIEALPKEARTEWDKLQPLGTLDLDFDFRFDGGEWTPDLTVRCRDVSFSYQGFAYRIERSSGTVRWAQDKIAIALAGFAGARQVRINGQLETSAARPAGWIEIEADQLPIDDKLLAALKEGPRKVILSLRPSGTLDLRARFWREAGVEAWERWIWLGFEDGSLNFERFAYPLDEVRGTAELRDGVWSFREWSAVNDKGRVTCDGRLVPLAEGHELALDFTGRAIQFEEQLKDALPRAFQTVWNDLEPRGVIDLESQVVYRTGGGPPSIWVRARPAGDTVSIEPREFRYRLERLHGEVTFDNGFITLDRLSAEHGRVKLFAGGRCDVAKGGAWRLNLDRLAVEGLAFDDDLLSALPPPLQHNVRQLAPSGILNVSGTAGLGGDPSGGAISAFWDLAVDVHRGALNCGVPLEHVEGGLSFRGGYDGEKVYSRGDLDIDSLTLKNCQFTEVRGPFWIDESYIFLGSRAAASEPGRPPRRIAATHCGGRVTGDCWVALEPELKYRVQADLEGADLARFAREIFISPPPIDGALAASIDLSGTGAGRNSLEGHGRIQLRDADIYRSPLMVRLLKIVSISPPEKSAFTESDIDFRIQGNHVYIDRINFIGDAVRLLGDGEMNLDGDIDLGFEALVRRQQFSIPIVRDVVGQVSRQALAIDVGGNLSDPVIQKRPLPAVSKALQNLQGVSRE